MKPSLVKDVGVHLLFSSPMSKCCQAFNVDKAASCCHKRLNRGSMCRFLLINSVQLHLQDRFGDGNCIFSWWPFVTNTLETTWLFGTCWPHGVFFIPVCRNTLMNFDLGSYPMLHVFSSSPDVRLVVITSGTSPIYPSANMSFLPV